MPRRFTIRSTVWTLVLTACSARWHRVDLPAPSELPIRQQVQLWSGPRSRVLHAVVVGPDAVSGVPFQLPPACDSCRVVMPRSAVDSMRLGDQEHGALRGFKRGFVVLGLLTVLLSYTVDRD